MSTRVNYEDYSRGIEREIRLAAARGITGQWEIAEAVCEALQHMFGRSTPAYPMKGGKQIYYKGNTYNIKKVGNAYKVTIES